MRSDEWRVWSFFVASKPLERAALLYLHGYGTAEPHARSRIIERQGVTNGHHHSIPSGMGKLVLIRAHLPPLCGIVYVVVSCTGRSQHTQPMETPTPHQQTAPGAPTHSRGVTWWPALRRAGTALIAVLLLALLWIASDLVVPATLASWTGRLQGFATVFLGIFIEALPFLLAGVLVSSLLHLFVSPERLQHMTPRHPLLAALSGALLGLALPVCECGSIPAARRLLQKGVALPVGIAFVLAAPVINPIVILSTLVAFGSWEMVAWRVGLTLLIAVVLGVLLGTAPEPTLVLARGVETSARDHAHDHACSHDHPHLHPAPDPSDNAVRQVLHHAHGEFFEMSRYLVAGALLAAALQTLIPQQALIALGDGPVLSVLVMMALAVVLSVCSTVDAFIALSFVNTFTPGSLLAFLVFGPMIDIKSTLMLMTTFRRRIVAIIVLLCFQLALLAGIVINFYTW